MNRTRKPWLFATLGGLLLVFSATVQAATYNVEHDPTADTLRLRDADTGVVSATSAVGCCDVVADGLATDPVGGRLFVLDATDTGTHLVTLALPGLGTLHDAALATGSTVSSLRYNAATGVLYALSADASTGTLALVALDPATGTVSTIGSAESNCCLVVPGSAALASDSATLLAVTRALDDTAQELSAWNLGTGVRSAYALASGRHVDSLVRDTAQARWLMLYRDDGGDQTLAQLTLPATVTPLATLTACCATLASTAAFDSGNGRLRFVARGDSTGTLRSYAFGTGGTVQSGEVLASSIGMIQTATASDVIFADGFEGVATLTGGAAQHTLLATSPASVLQALSAMWHDRTNNAVPALGRNGALGKTRLAASTETLAPARASASTLADPAIPVPTLHRTSLLLLMLCLMGLVLLHRRNRHRG